MRFDPTRRSFALRATGALAFAAVLATAGCAAATSSPAASTPANLPAGAAPDSYRLGAGDRVRVIVFGEDALTGEFEVSGAGALSLPLIGDVQAVGLTTPELQGKIAQELKAGYLRDPRVSVEVLTYRPFYILGEVNKPGEYAFTNGLTVMNAVATANGFTYRADVRRVYVKHAGETDEHLAPLDSTTAVAPGDTIRIRERYF